MKKQLFIIFSLCSLIITPSSAGNKNLSIQNKNTGGIFLPSKGTLNVLFVFAQFAEDNYQPDNPSWPSGGTPSNINSWVDSSWSSKPTQGSMTHYFNDMSLNSFKFIGKTVSVISRHPRQWYLDSSKTRKDIHKEIIQALDSTWDFAQFDNWHFASPYNHVNRPDSTVEMIFIVWRNIANEVSNDSVRKKIFVDLNMGRWSDLGGSSFKVDNGLRTIKTNYGGGGGGATLTDWFGADMFRFSIHEFAHYLLGGNEYHNGNGFWAMLSGYEVRSYMINSYERNRLGWGTIKTLKKTDEAIFDAELPDFITSGIAYRFEIDSASSQYFYIENHQKISYWDKCSKDEFPDDKGIFVIRQDKAYSYNGMGANWMWMIPAEGRFNWGVSQMAYPDYYPAGVPVFRKLSENKDSGYHSLEPIPYKYNGTTRQPFEVLFLEDPSTAKPHEYTARNGSGRDAFRIGFKTEFNTTSNPNNQRKDRSLTSFGFKLKSEHNGVYTLDIYTDY